MTRTLLQQQLTLVLQSVTFLVGSPFGILREVSIRVLFALPLLAALTIGASFSDGHLVLVGLPFDDGVVPIERSLCMTRETFIAHVQVVVRLLSKFPVRSVF